MCGHQPHHIIIFAQHVRIIAVAARAHLFRMAQKPRQRSRNIAIEFRRILHQPVQIRLPLRAAHHRARTIVKSALIQNRARQHAQIDVAAHQPPAVQLFKKRAQPVRRQIIALRVRPACIHERPVRLCDSDLR